MLLVHDYFDAVTNASANASVVDLARTAGWLHGNNCMKHWLVVGFETTGD